MKNLTILITLSILYLINSKALAQDAVFTQWELMPLHFNPALTGSFDGLVRLRSKYRNQWQSLLKNNSYKTSAASFEYNFTKSNPRKFSAGFYTILDQAGQLDFRTNSFNFTTSVIQNLGDPEKSHHQIAIGLNAGMANRKVVLDHAQWPGGVPPDDINPKVNFANVSVGLNWQYNTNTHFSFHLGAAIHHVNRPNISFFETGDEKLYSRFNLHGNVEIPLAYKMPGME
jgi:type IX secretion system PorP/SprF family membrane protein